MTDLTMGQRIAEERKKLGISQEALGEKTGVSRQAISKWESDGAVPEIDKLIALSKLFGVSVGWLLGVEEAPQPRQESQVLSEDQLRILEELVKKYQPQPKAEHPHKRWPSLLLAAAALCLCICLFSLWQGQKAQRQELGQLEARLNGLTSSLSSLESRIDALETARTREQTQSLLADYSLNIASLISASDDRAPTVEVSFSAVPVSWQTGDTAFLSARRSGAAAVQQECSWDGAFLTTRLMLDTADGYELCFTILHSNGTQEQQVLSDEVVENLQTSLSIGTEIICGEAWYTSNTLTLQNYTISVTMPSAGYDYGSMRWDNMDLVLYLDGTETMRYNLLSSATDDPQLLMSPSLCSVYTEIRFVNAPLEQNQNIQLWLEVKTNNNLYALVPVSFFILDANGKLQIQ